MRPQRQGQLPGRDRLQTQIIIIIIIIAGAVSVPEWVKLLPMVLTPFTYLLVFLESCCSHESDFLSDTGSEEETRQYIDHMRTVGPEMTTHVECYHRERRTRTKRDSKGNTTRETYYVTVVSWRGTKIYDIPYWCDATPETPFFTATCNTRLTLPDIIHFSDAESRQHFQEDRKRFVDENRHRDRYIRFYTDSEIPGLTKRHMVCGSDYVPPWWMTVGYYWLAVVLHLTWPYRWKLNAVTEEKELPIIKAISCRPPPPPQPIYNPGDPNAQAPYPGAPYPAPSYPPPDPSAPPMYNSVTPATVYGFYNINPDLLITTRGDADAPPTYEEAMGTGGSEHAEDGEGAQSSEGIHSFSNQEYFAQQHQQQQQQQKQNLNI